MNDLKVEGEEDLRKDPFTSVVNNVNKNAYQKYIMERNKHITQTKGIEQCFREIESLKGDMSEIKNMLFALLNK